MRKWIIFSIIILFLIFIGINEQILVRKELLDMHDKIITIQKDYKNQTGDIEEAINIKQEWNNKRTYLEYFMMHAELNIINQRLDEMISYLQTEDYDLAYTQACVLIGMLETMPSLLIPSFENIF